MKLLGITDERDSCDCCGKRGLKRVVALEKESGEVVYYGSNCAALALYGRKSAALARSVEELARWAGVRERSAKSAEMTDAEIDENYLASRMWPEAV